MKKYLKILGFAFKEQMEYRVNFVISMLTMVFNDFLFLFIYLIFVTYFTGTGLTMGNFILIHSIIAFQYALVNGVFSNIGDLPNIIEEGKLDYYLSFPLDALLFICVSKIKVHNLWDVIFALLSLNIYAFWFCAGNIPLFFLKRIVISAIALFFAAWLFLAIGSISFWLQKGSKVRDLFQSFFIVFWSYPPVIFQQRKLIFVLVWLVWLYPGVFLPYQMISAHASLMNRLVLIGMAVGMFFLGIYIFKTGLRKYSSGNLVVQM